MMAEPTRRLRREGSPHFSTVVLTRNGARIFIHFAPVADVPDVLTGPSINFSRDHLPPNSHAKYIFEQGQAGVEGMEVTGWLGLYGPPGLPDGIRKRLAAVTVEIVKGPEYAANLRAIAFEPTGQDMATFTAHHAAEFKRWVAFYKAIGLTK